MSLGNLQAEKGYSTYRTIDLDETAGGKLVKSGRCKLFGICVTCLDATPVYVKIYDAITMTIGAGTPKMTIGVPATTVGSPINIPLGGIEFETGIIMCCTTGVADNDTAGPGANECIVNLWYQ